MDLARRILSWVLLASVAVALGDAPYVDELFDALGGHDSPVVEAAQKADRDQVPSRAGDPARALRIYQALATIFMAPPAVALPAEASPSGYLPAHQSSPPSADPRRIDRPPAIPLA